MIICKRGGAAHTHATVAEVRSCYSVELPNPAEMGGNVNRGWVRQATESHATAQTPVDVEPGMYRLDETIYKVQLAVHGSGRPYAKRLVQIEQEVDRSLVRDVVEQVWKFEYAPGAIKSLRPEHKLSLEDAKAFGALYGTCCCCGATLTNEESIEKGIGPICEGKYF
jgi:hypothetical protein